MKSSQSFSQYVYFLSILIISLNCCSFSSVAVMEVLEEQPPIEQKKVSQKQRQQQRLNKRYNRLFRRFEQTTNSKKRYRLQQKIQQVERQQNDVNPAFTIGVISFAVSLTALSLLVLSFLIGGLGAAFAPIGLLLSIPGLILSIIAIKLGKKNPENSGKVFAIIAMIMSIVTLVLVIAYLLRDFTTIR
ncbi:MAG: hypothetical protein ACRBFS_06810 [Aureispira sp.]